MLDRRPSLRSTAVLVALAMAAVLLAVRTLKGVKQPSGIELEREVVFNGRTCYEARVARVPNGEEIWLQSGRRIVIQGADSPKGREVVPAVQALEELLLGRRVVVCPCRRAPQDRHGRWRAQVFLGDVSVAEYLLERCIVDLHYFGKCDSEIADRLYAAYFRGFRSGANRCRGKAVIDASEAAEHMGEAAIVEGTIKHARTDRNPLIFSLGGCKIVVFADDRRRLEKSGVDVASWDAGMRLRIFGRIQEYDGPEIVLRSSVQVLEVSR
ncbi:MAG TPA: hypothetical protein ENF73_06480 [Proteobacteria bacterium]|nr:hypothetical protein [Pseudomonadota bacterium]